MFTEGTVEGLYGHSKILLMTRAVLEKKLKEARAEGAHSPTVEAIAEVLRDHPTMMEGIRAALEPCPHEGAEWDEARGCWRYVFSDDDGLPTTAYLNPGDKCHRCDETMPPKPASAMDAEECAEECPYGWTARRRDIPRETFVIEREIEATCEFVVVAEGRTFELAWQGAAVAHREEAASC